MHCRLYGRIVFLKRRRPQHENRKTTKERKIHNRNIGRSFNKKFPDPKSVESFCRNKKRAVRTNRQLSLSGYLQTGEYNEMPFTLSCLTTAPLFYFQPKRLHHRVYRNKFSVGESHIGKNLTLDMTGNRISRSETLTSLLTDIPKTFRFLLHKR